MPGKTQKVSIGHVGIEVSKMERSRKFYEALAEALGLKKLYDSEYTIGWGTDEFAFWIIISNETRVKKKRPTGKEQVVSEHLAILVPDKATVNAVEESMRRKGFCSFFPPEELPQFAKGYYATSFCDPDNYVIEIYTVGS